MGAPLICRRCGTGNSFRAIECRECGGGLPGRPAPLPSLPRTRVPAAEWIGPDADIHRLWTAAGTLKPLDLKFDLHEFLDYCRLLRRLREEFARLDAAVFFDACLFFLRGSYGLWAYLNTSRPQCDLWGRATIFGGLNHGPLRKPDFLCWLWAALGEANAAGRPQLDLAIVDEVDSGTGIGTQMKAIRLALGAWRGARVDVRIEYIAVSRPDRPDEKLAATMRRWAGIRHKNTTMNVTFHSLVGTLLAYDNDELLGIIRRKHGLDENYELIRRAGSTIDARCPTCCHRDCTLQVAPVGAPTESVASLAASIASAKDRAAVRLLDGRIARRGCPRCHELWSPLRPSVQPPELDCRDHVHRAGRALCRQLCACVEK
jgi:hypothetical protein